MKYKARCVLRIAVVIIIKAKNTDLEKLLLLRDKKIGRHLSDKLFTEFH